MLMLLLISVSPKNALLKIFSNKINVKLLIKIVEKGKILASLITKDRKNIEINDN